MSARVLEVANIHLPLVPLGGAEKVLLDFVKGFSENGCKVVVIGATPIKIAREYCSSREDKKYYLKQINALLIPIESIVIAKKIVIPTLKGLRKLIQLIRWADLVHVHAPQGTTFPFLVTLLSKMCRKKVLVTALAILWNIIFLSKHSVKKIPFDVLCFLTLCLSDFIHVENYIDLVLARKIKRDNKKVYFLPPPVDTDYYSSRSRPMSISNYLLEKIGPYILYIGRISQEKGVYELIKAIRYVITDFKKNIRLVLAGPLTKTELENLRTILKDPLLKKHVIYVGEVDSSTKCKLMEHALAVAIPSLYDDTEAYCIVFGEAVVKGKPVIVSNRGALRIRARGYDGALVVEPEAFELAKAISIALATFDKCSKYRYRLKDIINFNIFKHFLNRVLNIAIKMQ